MSSAEEIKVEEKSPSSPPAAENGAAPVENGADKADATSGEKTVTSEGEEEEVVVAKEEKTMESKPERARKTILSEMCDHSKPVQQAPSFKVNRVCITTLLDPVHIVAYSQLKNG